MKLNPVSTEKKETSAKNSVEGPVPSAFCRYDKNEMNYLQVHLFKNVEWLANVRIPYKIDFESVVSELILRHAKNYFIVGCNYGNFKYLNDRGYKGIRMGREAILDLNYNHFKKRSLKELVRRGRKKGSVIEVPWSEESARDLREFRRHTRHGKEPQLRYLFNSHFYAYNRLFVIRDNNGLWLGAMLLSYKSKNFVQTEAMLTRRGQPNGVMEALIFNIFQTLKTEGNSYWTLGAVPFTIHNASFLSLEYFINATGRLMKFAYNYQGLFHFKDKFNPVWADYYICIRPRFGPGTMTGILHQSNLLKLGLYKLIHPGSRKYK